MNQISGHNWLPVAHVWSGWKIPLEKAYSAHSPCHVSHSDSRAVCIRIWGWGRWPILTTGLFSAQDSLGDFCDQLLYPETRNLRVGWSLHIYLFYSFLTFYFKTFWQRYSCKYNTKFPYTLYLDSPNTLHNHITMINIWKLIWYTTLIYAPYSKCMDCPNNVFFLNQDHTFFLAVMSL